MQNIRKYKFLPKDLEETIYLTQPTGFIDKGTEGKVCLLNKSLNGLKQSPRQWYLKFDSYIISCGFSRSRLDHYVYFKQEKDQSLVFILIYVDDMLIGSRDKKGIRKLKHL